MDKFKITNKTSFWIYVITYPLWKELEKYLLNNHDLYISSFYKNDIKVEDIILIYLKGNKYYGGFNAILQTKNKQTDNKHIIKIFYDNKMNKYAIDIAFLSIYKNVSLTEICKNINDKTDIIKNF